MGLRNLLHIETLPSCARYTRMAAFRWDFYGSIGRVCSSPSTATLRFIRPDSDPRSCGSRRRRCDCGSWGRDSKKLPYTLYGLSFSLTLAVSQGAPMPFGDGKFSADAVQIESGLAWGLSHIEVSTRPLEEEFGWRTRLTQRKCSRRAQRMNEVYCGTRCGCDLDLVQLQAASGSDMILRDAAHIGTGGRRPRCACLPSRPSVFLHN